MTRYAGPTPILLLAYALAFSVPTAAAHAALTVNLTLVSNGEQIDGESTVPGREGTIECFSFAHSITTPRDKTTAALTGRRQHRPVKVTKRVGKSSPALFNALVSESVVELAEFRFYEADPETGEETHVYTVRLIDAEIASIQTVSPDLHDPDSTAVPPLELLTLVYATIQVTYEADGTTHTDSWAEAP